LVQPEGADDGAVVFADRFRHRRVELVRDVLAEIVDRLRLDAHGLFEFESADLFDFARDLVGGFLFARRGWRRCVFGERRRRDQGERRRSDGAEGETGIHHCSTPRWISYRQMFTVAATLSDSMAPDPGIVNARAAAAPCGRPRASLPNR